MPPITKVRSLIALCVSLILPAVGAGAESLTTAARLERGETVRVVCLGDSITGAYYHTGGNRAWPELLEVALRAIYPRATVEVSNAGISGNSTADALKRLESDVLSREPHLVVVMLGMNDVAKASLADYCGNLREIARRVRERHAEIVFMTPNSVFPDDPRRPSARVAEYAEGMRRTAAELSAPLADAHRIYESIEHANYPVWTRLMSDSIHPNFRGHGLFAEEAALAISGRRVEVTRLPTLPPPGLPNVRARLKEGGLLRVIAMTPIDAYIGPALQSRFPDLQIEIIPWAVERKSLATLEAEAKDRGFLHFRNHRDAARPDLVVIAIPGTVYGQTPDQFYRSYTSILNWSSSFGRSNREKNWDCLAVLPSVLTQNPDPAQRVMEAFAREVIEGQDLPCIERRPGDTAALSQLVPIALADLLSRTSH